MNWAVEATGTGGVFNPTGNAGTNLPVPGWEAAAQPLTASAASPKLIKAAHEFEAQMMKELLKPMTESDPLTGDDNGTDGVLDSGAGSGGTLGEFASESLGKALSERGGFGIADRIVSQLSHSGNQVKTGTVTGKLHRDTAMSSNK